MKLKARIIVGFTMIILVPLLLFAAALYGFSETQSKQTVTQTETTDGAVYDIAISQSDGGQARIHLMTKDLFMSAFIILIFTALAIGLWLYRSIATPLVKLKKATQNIKEGNLDFVLDVEGNDEFSQLCQDFEEMRRRLKESTEEKNLIEKVMQGYQDYSYDAVMSALPASYRALADEDFNNKRYEEIKAWANEDYPVNEMPFPDAEIRTQYGRRVRSKGECLHLNILAELGIPVRYDSLMTFKDQNGETKTLSPDIVIQCFNRSLLIIEHLGRLSNLGYAMNFGEKCHWYHQGGFVLGKNFFVTSDDKYGGTDTQAIWQVALEVERLFYGD